MTQPNPVGGDDAHYITGRIVWENVLTPYAPESDPLQSSYSITLAVEKAHAKGDADFQRFAKQIPIDATGKFGKGGAFAGNGKPLFEIYNLIDGAGTKHAWAADYWLVKAKRPEKKGAPMVLNTEGQRVRGADAEELLFQGQVATIKVLTYAFEKKGNKGTNSYLLAVKIEEGGERLDFTAMDEEQVAEEFAAHAPAALPPAPAGAVVADDAADPALPDPDAPPATAQDKKADADEDVPW